MTQLPFPSTIEAQPRDITFLTIKTMVSRKTTVRRARLVCLDKAALGQGGGGGNHFKEQ